MSDNKIEADKNTCVCGCKSFETISLGEYTHASADCRNKTLKACKSCGIIKSVWGDIMNKHECNQMSKATELFREEESLSKKDIKDSGYSIIEDSDYGWLMKVPYFNGDWVCVEHQTVKNIKCYPFCMKHLIDSRSILDKEFI